MAHPKKNELYQIDTIVRLKRTGELARITKIAWLRPEQKNYFLHYEGEIEGREKSARWALYHDEIEFECGPIEIS